jgi:RNA polymerase sigma-70 factor (ECF subfamily)
LKACHKYESDALVPLIAKGNTAAFTELYERYWKKLFGIAYNRLKDMGKAEDVVHEVFASIWKNRNNLQIEAIENYLAVATKYAVFHQLKKDQQQAQVKNQGPHYSMASPDELVDYKQIAERIKTEVDKLPSQCRLIFKYSREAQMPVKEIAQVLQISPKTVENQLTKALNHLRIAFRSVLHIF